MAVANISAPGDDVVVAAQDLAGYIAALDRDLRATGTTVPDDDSKRGLMQQFWSFIGVIAGHDGALGGARPALMRRCREILGPWLFRSRTWNRAYYKPHGYAGDFLMIEWVYDLERDGCDDPTQPGIVNCLDHLMTTLHGARSLWERRRWFLRLLRHEHERRGGRLRILDVAAGGARYIRDFLDGAAGPPPDPGRVEITLCDQDPAALAFCRLRSLAPWLDRVVTRAAPITRLPGRLPPGAAFDVVIAAGLFDYLRDRVAAAVLAQLASLLAPGGVLAFSNFHPLDPSRAVKDWLMDWPLVYRDEAACARLFPATLGDGATARATTGALCYASARAPA